MVIWQQNFTLTDCTTTGELTPFLNEAMFKWNEALAQCNTGVRITDVSWTPGADFQSYENFNIKAGVGNTNLVPGTVADAFGVAEVTGDDSERLAGYVVINVEAIQSGKGFIGSDEVRVVVVHEIGHVLGLPHDTDEPSVMNAQMDYKWYGDVFAADVAHLQGLYGVK